VTRNIVSIDFEDWFHVCEVEHVLPRSRWDTYRSILDETTDWLLAELARRGTRATFFLVGYSAARNPELVRRVAREGHEIAYHGYDHEMVAPGDPERFRRDLRRGRDLLRGIAGGEVTGFRAPQWSLGRAGPWAVDVLVEEGFAYDSSRVPLPIIGRPGFPERVHTLAHSRGAGRLVEFPPLILRLPGVNVPAGGGWGLRCWPLTAILAKTRRLNRAGIPATFFFHPAEFVSHRFLTKLPLAKRFVLSFAPRPTRRAWDFLFDHLEFGPMGEAAGTRLASGLEHP
jgi:polysaccharide deacetylase family protein (PEP-CTERM system associated)